MNGVATDDVVAVATADLIASGADSDHRPAVDADYPNALRRALALRLTRLLGVMVLGSGVILGLSPGASATYRPAIFAAVIIMLAPAALARAGRVDQAAWLLWGLLFGLVVVPPVFTGVLGANVFFLSGPAAIAVLLLPGRAKWTALLTSVLGTLILGVSTYPQGTLGFTESMISSLILMGAVSLFAVVLVNVSGRFLVDLTSRVHSAHLLGEQLTALQEGLARTVAARTAELEAAVAAKQALVERLEHLNSIDELTGLANRRELDSTEIMPGLRAVVMVDLDLFKTINDTYGHAAGDEVLRVVAALIRERTTQSGTLVARYGGEEFVVVLPGASREAASAHAEALRRDIAGHRWTEIVPDLAVTASLGVAVGDRTEPTLRRADAAMHQAKAAGRNRVMHG